MKYMFLLFSQEPSPEAAASMDSSDIAASMGPWLKFSEDAAKLAHEVSGEALQHSSTATVVRPGGSQVVTTDGPFIETKEQIGGIYIFECADLDVAIKVASMIPLPEGHVEIRPVVDFEALMQAPPA